MRHHCILFFLFCVFWLPSHYVLAATTISIAPSQTLTFPMLGLPTGGSTINLSVSPLNSSTSGSAQIISGIASRGVYNLSSQGSGGLSISLDISGVNTGNAGLTLGEFSGLYNGTTINSFPSTTLALPNTDPQTTPLYLGATVTANSAVQEGNHTASFTITVFVQ